MLNQRKYSEKFFNQNTIEKIAVLAALKAGSSDNIAEVTQKIISDYFEEKEEIQQYNAALPTRRTEIKLLRDKRPEQKKKASKQAVDK